MGYSISDVEKLSKQGLADAAIKKVLGGWTHTFTINEWEKLAGFTTDAKLKEQIKKKQEELVANNRGDDSLLTKARGWFK
jgi:hypothetical protein